MKAVVDSELCTGCGLCEQTCPEVFKMEEDKAVAFVDAVPQEAAESCKQTAQDCPVEAIKIEE